MNGLGKNLVLLLCFAAAVLIVMGFKRKLGGDREQAAATQPSVNIELRSPDSGEQSVRPRVIQAKPITRHPREIVSPTASSPSDSMSTPPGPSITPIQAPTPAKRQPTLAEHAPQDAAANATPVDQPELPTVAVAKQAIPEFVITGDDDSFWSIAERVYGSGVYYRALFRHNETSVLRPDQLRTGTHVRTPSLDTLRQLYPDEFRSLNPEQP